VALFWWLGFLFCSYLQFTDFSVSLNDYRSFSFFPCPCKPEQVRSFMRLIELFVTSVELANDERCLIHSLRVDRP